MKKIFRTLLSQLPLSVPIVLLQKAQINLVTAIVIAFFCEVLAFVIIFGKKVWEELEPSMVKITADKVKITFLNIFSRFRRKFNKKIIYSHRVFNVRGLRTTGTYTLEIKNVFVELRIAPSHLQRAGLNPTAFREIKESLSVWEFLQRMKSHETVALAIIGPPGCGKTTLLQHIALILAANKQRRYGLHAYTPIFLFLREHAEIIYKEYLNLASLLQRHFSDQNRFGGLKPPPKWFKRQLDNGKCIVLLDGMDEVENKSQREKISCWLDDQIQNYPGCLFVVTSRPMGYREAPLTRANIVEVMPFNFQQTTKFVYNWYLANKIKSYGKDDPGVRQDARQQAKDLLARMRTMPSFSVLAVNPLLLTMVTMVHNYRSTLPERRVELYHEICDVLLGHWRKAKGIQDSLTVSQKRSVLQPLAAYMMEQPNSLRRQSITTKEAMTLINHHLKEIGLEDSQIPEFLNDVQKCSGLLLENEAGIWSFAHFTFQEYLCASHWHETSEANSWDINRWLSLIKESRWHETLRLYVAMEDATPIVRACLDLDTIQSLTLAADIAKEARRLQESYTGGNDNVRGLHAF